MDKQGSIYIREADKNDAAGFIELMNIHYARKKTIEYFLWQFIDSFFPARLFLACAGSKIIGCYGVQIRTLNDGRVCGVVIDIAILESYRHQGIFSHLEQTAAAFCRDKQCGAIAVFANVPGKMAHLKLKKWKNVGIIQSLELKRNELNSFRQSLGQWKQNTLISFAKNEEFRRWRFTHNPEYNYFINHDGNNHFTVSKIFTDPLTKSKYGDIVDMELNNYETDHGALLVQKTCLFLFDQGAHLITIWALPHTKIFEQLISLGFKTSEYERYFCLRIFNEKYSDLLQINNWELVQSDTEVF